MMSSSTHERCRDLLIALADDGFITAIVSQAGERRGWWTTERRWRRTYGRLMPDTETLATIVAESETPSYELCRIDMAPQPRDICGSPAAQCHFETRYGRAHVTRYPFDRDLPGLAAVAPGATVVRYRPGRRCTLRTVVGGQTIFVKVYPAHASARVFHDLAALHRAALGDGLRLAIAEPLSWEPSTRTLWQAAVPGRRARQGLCRTNGADLARRIGIAAASLARASLLPSQIVDGAAVLERSCRHARDLAQRVPRLSTAVNAVIERLTRVHARHPSCDLRPVHAAPHPDQWLETDDNLGLIDFDRFGLGDPELDAGIVLADLHALDRPSMTPDRLASAFLAGYAAVGIALREPLVVAYRAHQELARALRASQALRPDGDLRAEKRVASVVRLLAEAVPV